MPYFGLGRHIIIARFFAIHAMRTGRQMYWLLILFSFPLLGSVVFFSLNIYRNCASIVRHAVPHTP